MLLGWGVGLLFLQLVAAGWPDCLDFLSASVHATVCSVVMFKGVRSGTPVLAASGYWLA